MGAMISMGALDMGLEEAELNRLWMCGVRPIQVLYRLWWDVDKCVLKAVKERQPVKLSAWSLYMSQASIYWIAIWKKRLLCEATYHSE